MISKLTLWGVVFVWRVMLIEGILQPVWGIVCLNQQGQILVRKNTLLFKNLVFDSLDLNLKSEFQNIHHNFHSTSPKSLIIILHCFSYLVANISIYMNIYIFIYMKQWCHLLFWNAYPNKLLFGDASPNKLLFGDPL